MRFTARLFEWKKTGVMYYGAGFDFSKKYNIKCRMRGSAFGAKERRDASGAR